MKVLLLTAALLTATFAAAQTTPATTPKPAATTPTTPVTVGKSNLVSGPGYSFTAAGGWIMLKSDGGSAIMAGPAAKVDTNPSFIVEIADLKDVKPVNRNLGIARDVRAEELPTTIKDFKWLGEKTVRVGKTNVLGLLWSYSGKGKDATENIQMRWTQLTTIKGDKMYTVTLAVPDGALPQVATAGRAMFDSFTLR